MHKRPDYNSSDGREWIADAMLDEGGAVRIFGIRAHQLTLQQLDGLDDLLPSPSNNLDSHEQDQIRYGTYKKRQ